MDGDKCLSDKNHKWIYTYDYAPDSVWEPWRECDEEPEWIREEAKLVAGRVAESRKEMLRDQVGYKSCGDGYSPLTFGLLADSHFVYNGTWQDTAASMRAMQNELRDCRGETTPDGIALDGIIHLGDLSDGLLPLEKTRAIESGCISNLEELGVPVYIAPGNHDYNYFHGNPEVKYPDRPQYFVDYPEHKLRLIFIDSFDPRESVRYGFTTYCIHWLDACLRQMPEDYSAIVFSHVTPLVRLQAWAKDIRNRNGLIEVLDRYADRILAFINGHNHCDHIFNELKNGRFPLISINCAKCEYFVDHKPEGAVVPERRLGDRTQESFDIMQVDTANRKIFFTRFGAGSDRVVENGKGRYI